MATSERLKSGRLPQEIPNVIGREEKIKQVMDAIQSETQTVVVITGGPGFGKTAVANKVAHKLAKAEFEEAVFFCELRSKTTITEVTSSMILACSENLAQPPEAPQHWLLNWSKQLEKNVIFVLDNADHILDGDDHDAFLTFLHQMRTYSNQNVAFIVTSRQQFSSNDISVENITLGSLSPEAASQVLTSRVTKQKTRQGLTKVDKLTDLCGYVPLALCIVGPLLSEYYTEDKLIECLQQEPSVVLQRGRRPTDQTSVEKSIMSSFVVLQQCEKEALIRLCSFPGSFNAEAAESVIAARSLSKAQSILILRELKQRSLIEELSPHRYQIHQLIRQILMEKARKEQEFSGALDLGMRLACSNFVSCFVNNARAYWGYNTSKQAIVSFNEERQNFEYFLDNYVQKMVENPDPEDPDLLKAKKVFFDDLLQNCLYLEKCVLPSVYRNFLENLRKSIESSNHDQPVPLVELLCLLGHENRKTAAEYETCMKRAEKMYSKNRRKFEENPVSEVFFLNSDARFQSERIKNKELEKRIRQSLNVCQNKLGDHPEKAATFFYAGRFASRRKDYEEAVGKLEKALDLFTKYLGDHPMTAECLKNIADLFLGLDLREIKVDKTRDLSGEARVKSHEYYEKALAMMKELGMDDNKEISLTLKNFAACQQRNGDLVGATHCLQRAERIIEKANLEEDHLWRVLVKIQWAFLYQEKSKRGEEGSREKAIARMKEGLDMANRLGKAIYQLNSKKEILAFINDYPEEFPEDRYPRSRWNTEKN